MARVVPPSLLFLAWAAIAAADPVSQVGGSRLSFVVSGDTLRIPYYRNLALGGSYSSVERAAIMVHGTSRNAKNAYDNLVGAVAVAGVPDSTVLLVAPQFLTEEDISAHGLAANMLFWSEQGWKDGAHSLNTVAHPRPDSISDFAIMDSILYRIASRNPNLRTMVVAGHSAGGQFVNRYAAGNTMEQVLQSEFGVAVSYVVANPSSYLYFDAERVVPGTTDLFAIPPPESLLSCPDYDKYKYGLVQPNLYMSGIPPGQLQAQYSSRHVTCLMGQLDTDPADPSMDTTCPAEFQGRHRLDRARTYRSHLNLVFGSWVLATHRLEVVPGVGHDSDGIFTSVCGAALLFGGTACSTVGVADPAAREALDLSLSFPNPLRAPSRIRFRVPRDGKLVTLRVYDIRGRAVRTLVDGERSAGPGEVLWEGRSDAGAELAPGMYIIRLQQGPSARVTKMVLLR